MDRKLQGVPIADWGTRGGKRAGHQGDCRIGQVSVMTTHGRASHRGNEKTEHYSFNMGGCLNSGQLAKSMERKDITDCYQFEWANRTLTKYSSLRT